MPPFVERVLRLTRWARGQRVVNVLVTVVALGVSALAARHFAAAGWPFQNADPLLVAASGLLFVLTFPLKAFGWHRLFVPSQRPEAISLAAANGAASVSGAALPGRFDDAVRIAVVRRYRSCPSGVSTLALSLFTLGLIDAAALAPLSAAAAATSTGSPAVRAGLALVAAGGLGAALVVGFLPRLMASGRLIRFRVARWIGQRLTSRRDAWRAALLVLASWSVRAVALFLLLAAFDVRISFPLAIGFLCASAASSALPIAPAGAVTQAGAGAALLVASGVGVQRAIDFAVSAQALLILAGAAVVAFAAVWHAGQRLAERSRAA
ncbi:MAG: flippase-like domain-containing protein [Thermoleophilia bacterium]|nr:flippase-like domain-containing protein [Thermoleophilia bacterium]